MEDLNSDFLRELAKFNLLESYLKRKILFDLVSTIQISDESRANALESFLQSQKIELKQLNAYFTSKMINPRDAEDIILLDQRIEHYIFNVIGMPSIKARFITESKSLSNSTFDLLTFNQKLTCQFAYTKILEDSIPFVDIESLMPGKCQIKNYIKEPLTNLSPPIRYMIINSKSNYTSTPFQWGKSWCLLFLHKLTKPKLTHEIKLRIGRILLDEIITKKFTSIRKDLI